MNNNQDFMQLENSKTFNMKPSTICTISSTTYNDENKNTLNFGGTQQIGK